MAFTIVSAVGASAAGGRGLLLPAHSPVEQFPSLD